MCMPCLQPCKFFGDHSTGRRDSGHSIPHRYMSSLAFGQTWCQGGPAFGTLSSHAASSLNMSTSRAFRKRSISGRLGCSFADACLQGQLYCDAKASGELECDVTHDIIVTHDVTDVHAINMSEWTLMAVGSYARCSFQDPFGDRACIHSHRGAYCGMYCRSPQTQLQRMSSKHRDTVHPLCRAWRALGKHG